MSRPEPAPGRAAGLTRFSAAERWVHRSLAVLTLVCVASAAVLYIDWLSIAVGRRPLVAQVHLISGLLLPVPVVIGLVASAAMRADVRRLDRFLPEDWRWLRTRSRRAGAIPVGKFNAGQKLNSAFTAGWILVLLATGLVMHFHGMFGDDTRAGATFVHDLTAAAVVLVVAGHLVMAARDPVARAGMRTGRVERPWAAREHSAWLAEVEQESTRR